MISEDKINPLNVLNSREVEYPPPYFHYTILDIKYNLIQSIKDWILENLKHRFYIGETLVLDNGQFVVKLKIGFEEPKESSFFLLACSHLKYSNT
jgi:hypothetical protein